MNRLPGPGPRYLNTDLDLVSAHELTALATALEARGLFALHVTKCEDGLWRARFETEVEHAGPEANIAAMLTAVTSLADAARALWQACSVRELNIGHECRLEPRTLGYQLPGALLAGIAASGASLAFTTYLLEDTEIRED